MHTFPVSICICLRISDVGQLFMYLLGLYVFFDRSVVRIFIPVFRLGYLVSAIELCEFLVCFGY